MIVGTFQKISLFKQNYCFGSGFIEQNGLLLIAKMNMEQCADRWKDFLTIELTMINICLIQDRYMESAKFKEVIF